MALWLVTRLFGVVFCAIVSNAFPSRNGNDGAFTNVSVYQKALSTRDHEPVSIRDLQDIEELGNETIAAMDLPLNDVKDKIGNLPRRNAPYEKCIKIILSQHNTLLIPHNDDVADVPDPCQNARIDAITTVKSGSKFAFQGDYYWKLLENEVDEAYPRRISEDWDGLEGNLDAAFTFTSGETYFFKGTKYWRFVNKTMDSGFPKQISDGFEGIPNNLDAAFVWGRNDKTYFFKEGQYWRYEKDQDPPVHPSYPAPLSAWSDLIADGIDAAVQWDNGITYFFKGQYYYRYDDENSQVLQFDPPYPRLTSKYWFGCP